MKINTECFDYEIMKVEQLSYGNNKGESKENNQTNTIYTRKSQKPYIDSNGRLFHITTTTEYR